MYAKLENNRIVAAPSEVVTESQRIYNPPSEVLVSLGYKEVIYPTYSIDDTDHMADQTPTVEVYTEDADHIYVAYIPAPTPPTPDHVQLREDAYRAEADQYLIAYHGYILEGETDKAQVQMDLYLAMKGEIRARFNETI